MQFLKLEDSIHFKGNAADTLGGFVTKTNISQKIYSLTCNHLIPKENENTHNRDSGVIGAFVFTNRGKGCDFAAIKIKDCYSKSFHIPHKS